MSSCAFLKSTIGRKVLAALTGLVLFGFVAGHMTGNLKAFKGIDPVSGKHHLDIYAEFLRTFGQEAFGYGGFLWIARIVLLATILIHIFCVASLHCRNKAARPQGYKKFSYKASTSSARSMWWGGLAILLFVIYHILHFTTGDLHFQGFKHGEVYANVYYGFQVWYVFAVYLIAMCALGLHLYHGAWSFFQTLGIDNPEWNAALRRFAQIAAIVIFLGFISVPVAVVSGMLPAPGAHHAAVEKV